MWSKLYKLADFLAVLWITVVMFGSLSGYREVENSDLYLLGLYILIELLPDE